MQRSLRMRILSAFLVSGCSTGSYMNTVEKVEISKFMGSWYVLAGRFTFLETEVHNGLEIYTWNESKERIDVEFTYYKGGFEGDKKSIPQKAWIFNRETNAHWKVSPLWPLKLDYLIVELDENYQWTAVGVPNQKFLWIMARDWKNAELIIAEAVRRLEAKGYNAKDIVRVPHRW